MLQGINWRHLSGQLCREFLVSKNEERNLRGDQQTIVKKGYQSSSDTLFIQKSYKKYIFYRKITG